MPTFPTTLPAPQLSTLQETPPNNTIRTQMEKGVDKVRRRTTAAPRLLSFNLALTPAQISTLDTFYDTTTYSGSISFDYTHPRTLAACTARFVDPPSYSEREGKIYIATISLEILP